MYWLYVVCIREVSHYKRIYISFRVAIVQTTDPRVVSILHVLFHGNISILTGSVHCNTTQQFKHL